ncbi:hypothetical protein E4631_06145 [Hymenobacter sp. UV11]|uniref:hypothetical protein n=1 Tax=Hymenobacter sp. UV11 TaxID=1849735 RepID=UPI0010605A38|nr:hypothetical protein [Hymenobacter sp. UV11]TDN38265.1 hypothetical protein A8B98_24990 [Hymenobacter sp. UV11]TFZ67558.1 hypothetical protein E4631_06145 [Hymenobacter sp. UV11]
MGNFSKTLVRRLSGHPPRPAQQTGLPANEGQIALPDGRKFWMQRVHREDWHRLLVGAQLLLIRTKRRHEPWQQAVEMATIDQNNLDHPTVPILCLAWGWLPEGEPDKRPATILRLAELHIILRYELRESHCPEVVAAISPSLN